MKSFGLYVLLLVCGMVSATCDVAAQNISSEISTYDLRSDELPDPSRYELFEIGHNLYSTYEQIRSGYMPVGYAFHGRRDHRVMVAGFDVADGINRATVSSVALRLRTAGYPSDTLLMAGEELYGRRNYAINPFAVQREIRRIGAVALAGKYSGGVNGRLAAKHRGVSYHINLKLHGGPSLYGSGIDSYGGFLSTTVSTGGLSFLLAVAPSAAGCRTATTDEAFELSGRTLYNPSTGWDGGRLRNARIRKEYIPTLIAKYDAALGQDLRLNIAAMGRYGAASRSGLDWYNGLSPYPDHYRALPSGMKSSWAADKLRELWRVGAPDVTGVDWASLRQINRANGHAMYVVASQVERVATLGGRVGLSGSRGECSYRVGTEFRWDNSALYKQIDDLLDASHALNIDYFESELSVGQVVHNDVGAVGKRLGVGDRSDYNFVINRLAASLDGDIKWSRYGWHANIDFKCGLGTLSRTGLWQKSSRTEGYGSSKVHLFADCALDLALRRTWSVHTAEAKVWAAILPPEYRNLYLSPENSSEAISHPTGTVDRGIQLSYLFCSSAFSARVVAHVAKSHNGMEVYRYYDDIEECYSDMAVTDLSSLRCGIDLSVEGRLSERWNVSVAASWLRDVYLSNPSVTLFRDIDGEVLSENNRSALKGLRTGCTPEFTALCEVSGRLPEGWRLSGSVVGFGGRFIEPNPLYRMERTKIYMASPESYAKLSRQKRLDNTLGVGVNLSKIFERSGVAVSMSVDALVAGDKTYYAYEQMRLRSSEVGYTAAPLKRLYSMPVTAVISISYTL